jgi:hypothetical protein
MSFSPPSQFNEAGQEETFFSMNAAPANTASLMSGTPSYRLNKPSLSVNTQMPAMAPNPISPWNVSKFAKNEAGVYSLTPASTFDTTDPFLGPNSGNILPSGFDPSFLQHWGNSAGLWLSF